MEQAELLWANGASVWGPDGVEVGVWMGAGGR